MPCIPGCCLACEGVKPVSGNTSVRDAVLVYLRFIDSTLYFYTLSRGISTYMKDYKKCLLENLITFSGRHDETFSQKTKLLLFLVCMMRIIDGVVQTTAFLTLSLRHPNHNSNQS